MNRCYARLLDSPQKVTLSLSKSAGLPEAQPTLGVRTRQRRGVPGAGAERCDTLSTSSPTPPATVREPHTDSSRTGVWWECKPAISTRSRFTLRIPLCSRRGGCQEDRLQPTCRFIDRLCRVRLCMNRLGVNPRYSAYAYLKIQHSTERQE
ncbi:MAG: hypothetical protein J07HQW1_01766 [Haloquadratum walsbyi J07HQW1]|uniref:Uncharacterized protein n=1 Tax=Haloquadratum walsbyi J07HQW1 TaxID=1238424 RepID=U1PDR5_9EURY|nr:MAG: hypothetical protein J07HQW1_01766 [Haloquadratum walsbyi J07HQW1]